MISEITLDEPALSAIVATRAELSAGEGTCTVYFGSTQGREAFMRALEILKLYRPSLRSGLAKIRQSRYTPDLHFVYDEELEEKLHLERLLDAIKEEDHNSGI